MTQADKVGQTDRIIQFVTSRATTTTHRHHGQAHFTGIHGGHETAVDRKNRAHDGSLRQVVIITFHEVRRTTEAGHHATEDLGSLAIVQHRLQLGAGIALIAGQTGGGQHLGSQCHGHCVDPRVAVLTGQVTHRFTHFYRIAGAGGQHLVHIGQAATEVRQPAPLATATMLLASSSDASKVGIKAPEPTFTSITSASSPEASFLERMEPVNHGDRFDGGGDVPYCIDTLVSGGEIAGLDR